MLSFSKSPPPTYVVEYLSPFLIQQSFLCHGPIQPFFKVCCPQMILIGGLLYVEGLMEVTMSEAHP